MFYFQGVLQSSFVDSLLQQTIGVSGSDVLQSLSTASNFDQRQIQLLEAITKLISQYVSCVEADRFLAFDTEEELAAAALKLNEDNLVMAGEFIGIMAFGRLGYFIIAWIEIRIIPFHLSKLCPRLSGM